MSGVVQNNVLTLANDNVVVRQEFEKMQSDKMMSCCFMATVAAFAGVGSAALTIGGGLMLSSSAGGIGACLLGSGIGGFLATGIIGGVALILHAPFSNKINRNDLFVMQRRLESENNRMHFAIEQQEVQKRAIEARIAEQQEQIRNNNCTLHTIRTIELADSTA